MSHARGFLLALGIYMTATSCFARYVEEMGDDNDGAWMFAYVILLLIGLRYVAEEMKKGGASGAKAIAIVAVFAIAAYLFPIVNGILIAGVAVAFAYGMIKKGL